ncbi:MAG: hypothetical protein Q9M37_03830 [Desulfonauticus sp.]|nr:hypothetical protein [Desulfonauticus sp.]
MELKEKIKKEIDLIPEEYLPQLEQYLNAIKCRKRRRLCIKKIHLKGKYDNLKIRKLAYE